MPIRIISIGKGLARSGQNIVFASSKPSGAIFRRRTANFSVYVRGREIIFIPKKNVVLRVS